MMVDKKHTQLTAGGLNAGLFNQGKKSAAKVRAYAILQHSGTGCLPALQAQSTHTQT